MQPKKMIENLNHITFSVHDLDESFDFYTDGLGFRPLARWDKGVYLLAGEVWICLTLDAKTRKEPPVEYTHVAFTVARKNFEEVSSRILNSGVRQWQENQSEGKSLYFLDPNGHKLEIHEGDWFSRLETCRQNPYPGMVFFD